MSKIKNKLLVLSGKGGVGKSTFATQLAFALAAQGKEVCTAQQQRRQLKAQHAVDNQRTGPLELSSSCW